MSSFAQQLAIGRVGESAVAQYLKHKGYHVMPVYEIEIETGKGPQLFSAVGGYVAPDMFAFKSDGSYTCWIEAKRKTRFSWYGKGKCFVTGIDLRHWSEYCKVQELSPWDVWIMFLHMQADTWPEDIKKWGAPEQCPTGLFGKKLRDLKACQSHTSDKHGRSGMVYWSVKSLSQIAALEEIEAAAMPSTKETEQASYIEQIEPF